MAMLAATPTSAAMRRVEPVAHARRRHGDDEALERVACGRGEALHQTGGERSQLRPVVDVQRHRCLDSKPVSRSRPAADTTDSGTESSVSIDQLSESCWHGVTGSGNVGLTW